MKKITFGNEGEFELEVLAEDEFVLRRSDGKNVGVANVAQAFNVYSLKETIRKLSPQSLILHRLILRVRIGGDPFLNAAVLAKIAAHKVFTDVSISAGTHWDIVVWSADGGPGLVPGTYIPRS